MPAVLTTPLSILVADDEEGIRTLLAHWLQRSGHAVTCVGNGAQASRAIKTRTFDLIITDVVMPDGDGFELISHCRKALPSTPIVAISGGGKYLQGADCLKMARGLGAHAIVIKPFNWEQLHAGIDAALQAAPRLSH
jgi:CheY-like chemotaxis protein